MKAGLYAFVAYMLQIGVALSTVHFGTAYTEK
jgi:hypothetical protein